MNVPSRALAEEAVAALIRCNGNQAKAAAEIGIHRTSIIDRLRGAVKLGISLPFTDIAARVSRDLARQGWAPDYDLTHEVPDGLTLKGTSIRYDGDGSVQQYWNKTKPQGLDPEEAINLPDPKTIIKLSTLFDQEGRVIQQWRSERPEDVAREAAWRSFAEALIRDIPPATPVATPVVETDDLVVEIPIGDHHFGMFSWDKETGDDYDLTIAENLLMRAAQQAIDRAPSCRLAVIEFLGDLTHYDSFVPETPRNRNKLDSDTRFGKMAIVAQRVIIAMIDAALKKFEEVRVVFVPGNHDPLTSKVWLKLLIAGWYRNAPRVKVDMSQMDFLYWEFGKCLVGCYHGHDVKMQQLPLIMAQDRPEAWARTEYRYWRTGHVHHDKVWVAQGADFGKVWVESVRVLPPPDAWAHAKGYRPLRDMKVIVLHRQFGEWDRYTIPSKMLQDRRER